MKKLFLIAFLFLCTLISAQEHRITTSDGVNLYVNIKGEGTPVLYLHGGPGSGSYWLEHFYGDFLEKNFTVVYLDQRGVGRSGSPEDGNYSLDRMAMDFEEVRKSLGFKNWITMGHSFGGLLQMGYIERYPESVSGMIMINCTLNLTESFCESWAPKATEFLQSVKISPPLDSLPIFERVKRLGSLLRENNIFWKMAYAEPENQNLMEETYKAFPDWNYDFGNAALEFDEYWANFKPATSRVKKPVLFFYGTKDWMVGPKHYQTVSFPEMLLWRSEGGHMPFQENQEVLSAAILDFKEKYQL